MELLCVDDWARLLVRKQQILDAITVSDPPQLFARTIKLIEQLRKDQQLQQADALSKAIDENGERFVAIVALEDQARKLLSSRVAGLHDQMVNISLKQKAQKLYHPKVPDTSSRFLNGMI